MEDEYIEDAEFYDGLEEDPGRPYMELKLPAWLTGERVPPAPESAPEPSQRLLTPEEFMAKHNLPRPQ